MPKRNATLAVLIPSKNEEKQIARCLDCVRDWADEIVVVDSKSTDNTISIATDYGADVLQFDYKGGWPKKRNWALQTHPWKSDWILLLDADEILTEASKLLIDKALEQPTSDGYWLSFEIFFLGRQLRHGDTRLWKLSLFRTGKGLYEQRALQQDTSMADMEIHEHVVVDGSVEKLDVKIRHENIQSLDHYILKHNVYSNWEVQVIEEGVESEVKPSLFGTQAQRRRWLKQKLLNFPGFPILVFLYTYIFKLGFLDGRPGLIYATFRMIQFLHVKAKLYEHAQAHTPTTSKN